jgi:hypothetical protein
MRDLLLLSAAERTELMRLARPELSEIVSQDSSAVYTALYDIRKIVKRLWTATSEAEILTCAAEEARRMLPEPDLLCVQGPLGTPLDESLLLQRRGLNVGARVVAARWDMLSRFTPEQLARIAAAIRSTEPGELVPLQEFPIDLARLIDEVGKEHGIVWNSVVAASISQPTETLLLNALSLRGGTFAGIDIAVLSAIAEFASLAMQQ